MKSGFVSGYDYDDAPTHPTHGGKLTAGQCAELIAEQAARIAELEAELKQVRDWQKSRER